MSNYLKYKNGTWTTHTHTYTTVFCTYAHKLFILIFMVFAWLCVYAISPKRIFVRVCIVENRYIPLVCCVFHFLALFYHFFFNPNKQAHSVCSIILFNFIERSETENSVLALAQSVLSTLSQLKATFLFFSSLPLLKGAVIAIYTINVTCVGWTLKFMVLLQWEID